MAIVNVPALFAVIATGAPDKLETAIKSKFPDDYYQVADGSWLIATNGTSKELCDLLGISDGSSGTGMVVRFSNYFGRASKDMWEWIASRLGVANG